MEETPLCSCLEKSTAHGISHAAVARSPVMRGFWILFFLIALGVFCRYFYANYEKFISEPTSVTVEVDGAKFIIPDIHLCNLNPLARSRLIDSLNVQSPLVVNLIREMTRIEETVELYAPQAQKENHFWASIQKEKLFAAVGHVSKQTIVYAEVGLESELDWTRFEITANFNHFTCFRGRKLNETEFNGTASSLNLHLYTDSYHFKKTPLTFNGQSLSNYDFLSQPSVMTPSGILLIFTPPGEYPHLESHSVLLSPGRYTTIKLKMQKTVSVNTQHDPCMKDEETITYHNPLLGMGYNSTYVKTLSDCKYRKIVTKLMKEQVDCQCIPHMVPVTPDMAKKYPVCGNFSNNLNATTGDLLMRQSRCIDYYYFYDTEFDVSECKDEKPCETVTYSSDVSSTDWPLLDDIESIIEEFMVPTLNGSVTQEATPGLFRYLDNIVRNTTRRNDMTKYNFARVNIRAGEGKSLQIVEQVSYGLENLISDLGGLAGLFLGMSFLTILEIFDLIFDCVYARGKRRIECDDDDQENWKIVQE